MQEAATNLAKPQTGVSAVGDEAEAAAGYYGLQILPPLTAVVELAAIVALLLVVDWIWPALDINNILPSPYWLPVLLLTLQYGTASGSLAVVVAIIVYFTFVTLPEQGVGENEFAYRLRVLSQPILWIAAAVVLGQFRMVQIAAKRELLRRVGELETQRETLADYANRLRTRCDALERDIAARPFLAGASLLDGLAALADGHDGVGQAIEACFAAAFPGAAVSLFVRQGAGLSLAVNVGWADGAPWAKELAPEHALYKAVVGEQAALSILNAADEAALSGEGLAAVPVIQPRTGRVLGLIKLEAADARLVSDQIAAQLGVMAAVIEPALVETATGVCLARISPAADPPGTNGAAPVRQLARLISPIGSQGVGDGPEAAERMRPKVGR